MASFRRVVCTFVYAGYIIIKGEYLLKLRFFFLFLSDYIVVTAKKEPDFYGIICRFLRM